MDVIVGRNTVEEVTLLWEVSNTCCGWCKQDIRTGTTLDKRTFFQKRKILIPNMYLEIRKRILKGYIRSVARESWK